MNTKQQEKFRRILLQELKKGKNPEDLLSMAQTAGISEKDFFKEVRHMEASLSALPSFLTTFLPFLKTKEGESSSTKIEEAPSVWDPLGEKVFLGKFQRSKKKLFETFRKYQENPNIPRRNAFFFSIPILILVAMGWYDYGIILSIISAGDGDGGILLTLPFAPLAWYVTKVFRLQRDLIKIIIAEKRKWIYSPDERKGRWMNFSTRFPRIFRKGNKGQNIQDEFWGKFQEMNFWTGIFEYKERHGSGKNARDVTYRKTIFTMPLEKKLSTTFELVPEGITQKISDFFSSKDIDVESTDFNKKFTILYAGKKVEKQMDIVQLLSPSLQVRLLDLWKDQGKFSVLFQENIVLYSFEGNLLKKMKSNFFRKIALNPKDEKKMDTRFQIILELTNDILPFLR